MQLALSLLFGGPLLAVCGFVYRQHPNLFRRGIWLKTSVAIRTMTPEAYEQYIKGMGRSYVIIGCVMFGAGVLLALLKP